MAKKYYAVKVGKTTGIYETWEECKANVDGFPGALYKSFKSLTDAYDYMGYTGTQLDIFSFADDNSNNSNISDISHSDSSVDAGKTDTTDNAFEPDGPNITTDTIGEDYIDVPMTHSKAVAYVDGSYNADTKIFGYGVVFFYDNKKVELYKSYDDEEMATMRNVAGEIYGSMVAMEYAIEHNIPKLDIYYDYMGIEKWCTGQWKAGKAGTIAYKKYYNQAKKKVHISFCKVKGHSGDKYNDLADALAKKACGIE